jgi:hypothetical protein
MHTGAVSGKRLINAVTGGRLEKLLKTAAKASAASAGVAAGTARKLRCRRPWSRPGACA